MDAGPGYSHCAFVGKINYRENKFPYEKNNFSNKMIFVTIRLA